jgi:hypothetical protein
VPKHRAQPASIPVIVAAIAAGLFFLGCIMALTAVRPIAGIGGALVVFGGVALAGCLYLLPTIIAHEKKLSNGHQILWVNLLFGWTLAGWLVALCMALAS